MPIDTVLIDLDGTLIPMEQPAFIEAYFSDLAQYLAEHGHANGRAILGAVMRGVDAMIQNDGGALNEARFWDAFCAAIAPLGMTEADAHALEPAFDGFYSTAFDAARRIVGPARDVRGLLRLLRKNGRVVYLATNPLFPPVAVRTRLNWIGLAPEDFDGVTTYDNSRYCKPNPAYYTEILERLGRAPETSIMIGNNPSDDLSALEAGLSGYLVTDYLENELGLDITPYRSGTFDELMAFAETME